MAQYKQSEITNVFWASNDGFKGGRALIKWAQDDSEKNMFSKETDGFYISKYNEDEEFGHSNKPGRQYFKVFGCSDSTETLVLDGEKCVF